MKNYSFILFIVFCFIYLPLFPQERSSLNDFENTLTRNRIQIGYSSIIREDDKPELKNVFLNLNHRSSKFNPYTKSFKINWALEPGINFLLIDDNDIKGLGVVPYGKVGPEMSLFKNMFIGGNVGIGASLFNYFFIYPFVGLNAYYLIPLDKNLFIELESGFHTSYVKHSQPYLIYIAGGISIK